MHSPNSKNISRPGMHGDAASSSQRLRFKNPDSDPRGRWLPSDLTFPGVRPSLIYELAGHMPREGRSWRVSRARAEELLANGQVIIRAGRPPALKRYLAEKEPSLENPDQPPSLFHLVREFSCLLARRLALHPQELSVIEWRDLERAICAALDGLGFATKLTRAAKDGGFDIEARTGDAVYLIEVKHWSVPSLVGDTVVSAFAEVVVIKQATRGLLLSSSGFRPAVLAARLEITPASVALGDGRKIIGLCQRYHEREQGLWVPESSLPDLLFADTD